MAAWRSLARDYYVPRTSSVSNRLYLSLLHQLVLDALTGGDFGQVVVKGEAMRRRYTRVSRNAISENWPLFGMRSHLRGGTRLLIRDQGWTIQISCQCTQVRQEDCGGWYHQVHHAVVVTIVELDQGHQILLGYVPALPSDCLRLQEASGLC